MKKRVLIVFLTLLAVTFLTAAQETGEMEGEPEKKEFIPGLIFNTSNLLLDLNAYQGGAGVKLLYSEHALRFSAGAGYIGADSRLEITAGAVYEKPFYTGRVTPYWGGVLLAGYSREGAENDSDYWEIIQGFEASLGGILGVEFFLMDYLSVFAEYELAAGLAWSQVSRNAGGTLTKNGTTNFTAATGLGNNASLGVVVYLKPSGRMPLEEDS